MMIWIEPTADNCIESLSKKEYHRLMQELLAIEHEDKALEQNVQLLLTFIENADFSDLRAQCDQVCTLGKKALCCIESRNGSVTCRIVQKNL